MLESEGRVLRSEFQEKYNRIVDNACTRLKEEVCRLEKRSETLETLTNHRISGCLAHGALEKAKDERAVRRREAEKRRLLCERERYLKQRVQAKLRHSRHLNNKEKVAIYKFRTRCPRIGQVPCVFLREALRLRKTEAEMAETEQRVKDAKIGALQRRRNANRVIFRRKQYRLSVQCRKVNVFMHLYGASLFCVS